MQYTSAIASPVRRPHAKIILWFCVLSAAQATAATLEVRLREEPARAVAVVRLGHIAVLRNVTEAERRRLEAIDICPAPAPGDRLRVDRDDIRRVLVLEGIPGKSVTFVGPGAVVLTAAEPAAPQRATPDVARRVSQAIAEEWASETQMGDDAHVKLVRADLPDFLDDYHVTAVERLDGGQRLTSGIGKYRVVFARGDDEPVYPVEITASVEPVVRVVVAARSLSRGERITAADVALQELPTHVVGAMARNGRLIHDPSDVIGLEVQRNLAAGRPIDSTAAKRPLVIRRRDQVSVVLRYDGFVIRTLATALGDARLGESVELENSDRKSRFVARAIGPQAAELQLVERIPSQPTSR